MTQEEKAKAYDEAIERVNSKWHYKNQPCVVNIAEIFPELKSEDERIREAIIDEFKGEFDAICDRITPEYDDTDEADKRRMQSLREYLAWLEKQGEQKPANKVEPRFKVGDWIISHYNNVACIKSIEDKNYFLSCSDGNNERLSIDCINRNWRLWTIQDAKDGDVLYTSSTASNEVFIFKGLTIEGYIECYCSYDSEDKYREGKYHFIGKPTFMTHPATKEQRDTLMKAMADAGYEFDFEKKELKRIEIEIPFGAKDSELQEATYYIPKGFHAEIDDDKVVIKKGKNSEWSEEDEKMIDNIIDYMMPMPIFFTSTKGKSGKEYTKEFIKEAIDWLKSLRPQSTWKPSDEQMGALRNASIYIEGYNSNFKGSGSILEKLYNDLKKLRGELL